MNPIKPLGHDANLAKLRADMCAMVADRMPTNPHKNDTYLTDMLDTSLAKHNVAAGSDIWPTAYAICGDRVLRDWGERRPERLIDYKVEYNIGCMTLYLKTAIPRTPPRKPRDSLITASIELRAYLDDGFEVAVDQIQEMSHRAKILAAHGFTNMEYVVKDAVASCWYRNIAEIKKQRDLDALIPMMLSMR